MLNKATKSLKNTGNKAKKRLGAGGAVIFGLLTSNADGKSIPEKNAGEANIGIHKSFSEFKHSISQQPAININEVNKPTSYANFDSIGGDPDTTEVKNFFLTKVTSTPQEVAEFTKVRNEAKKSPNREALWNTIKDVYTTYSESPLKKAIFIFALLDPHKVTSLGKDAFTRIDTNQSYKSLFIMISELYVSELEILAKDIKIKNLKKEGEDLDKKLKEQDDVLKMLDGLINIYKTYNTAQ